MKAKEYLQQIYRLSISIDQKIEEADMLRSMAMNPGSPAMQVDKVQTSKTGDRINSITERYMELHDEVIRQQQELAERKHRIIDQIQKMKDATYMNILYKRYVKLEPMTQIAYEMRYNYTWLCELHGNALDAFEQQYLKEPKQTEEES